MLIGAEFGGIIPPTTVVPVSTKISVRPKCVENTVHPRTMSWRIPLEKIIILLLYHNLIPKPWLCRTPTPNAATRDKDLLVHSWWMTLLLMTLHALVTTLSSIIIL